MAGLLDFFNRPVGFGGATGWDQLGLLGGALSGAGAGYNSRRRPIVSTNPAEVQPGSSGFAEMGLGAQQGLRQGQQDLQRRALIQTQMAQAQTAEEERRARLAEQERRNQAMAAYQAAVASGDPARVRTAFASLDPAGHFKETFDTMSPEAEQQKIRIAQATQKAGSSDIQEYEYAKQQGYRGTFQDWIAIKRQGAGEYGLNPIFGVDQQGNPVMMQAGKSGSAIQSRLPPGVTLSKEPLKIDAGTHVVLIDPITRQPVATVPKNVAGEAQQQALGKAQGEAQTALPAAETKAETALKTIEQLESHPGRGAATGTFAGKLPAIPNTQAYDFVKLHEQAKGQAFLAAFQELRGGGAITEQEGIKAQAAIDRLDRASTKEGYDAALNDLKEVIRRGVENAKKKAGQGSPDGGWTTLPNGVRIREKR